MMMTLRHTWKTGLILMGLGAGAASRGEAGGAADGWLRTAWAAVSPTTESCRRSSLSTTFE